MFDDENRIFNYAVFFEKRNKSEPGIDFNEAGKNGIENENREYKMAI